jgi:uncharacterized RDD family membrane protein YckC
MQEPLPNSSIETVIADSGIVESLCDEPSEPVGKSHQTSTLIEFPGSTRQLPEWRKQLSQRVREVQDRRAREAAEEAAAARQAGAVSCALPSAQLELVPDLEQRVVNPIVSKALERIERARHIEVVGGYTGVATAPALEPVPEVTPAPEAVILEPVETRTKLTVVAPPKPEVAVEPNPEPLAIELDAEPSDRRPEPSDRKPVRLISGSVDDVALAYLETCLSLPPVAVEVEHVNAGFGRRFIAGIFDLLMVTLMAAPVAAAIEFSDGDWSDPRVIGLMSSVTVLTMFSYLTISIALTGRTLAMRIFSLRTIDLRTGLIPTGGQAMKRAVGYIFALALGGLGLVYALIDPDGRTMYDRFSKTIVILD